MFATFNNSNRYSYLKFNIPEGVSSDDIHYAELQLNLTMVAVDGPRGSNDQIVFYEVENTTWGEHTITFNNQETVGRQLNTVQLSTNKEEYCVDLTEYIKSIKDRGTFSLVFNVKNTSTGYFFHARESNISQKRPALRLTFLDDSGAGLNRSANDFSENVSFLNDTKFSLYPNPTKDNVKIETQLEVAQVDVIDLTGRVRQMTKSSQSIKEIDLSNLPSGTYLIKMTTNDGFIVNKVTKL